MSRTLKQMKARAAHAARRAAGPLNRPEVWHAYVPRYGVTRTYWAGYKVKQRRIDRVKAKEAMRSVQHDQ